MITPFVMLNVAGVQKFAPFRYQHWYARVHGAVVRLYDRRRLATRGHALGKRFVLR